MNKHFSRLLLPMACWLGCAATAAAQNDAPFHLELDYTYELGVASSATSLGSLSEGYKYGHGLTLNALYNLRPDITVGVGGGLRRYDGLYSYSMNTLPVYASLRYRPLAAHRSLYAYTEQGWCLLGNSSDANFWGGYTGSIGVGCQLMRSRHFGFNFRLGYNLQQFHGCTFIKSFTPAQGEGQQPQIEYEQHSIWRHSIQIGLGLVF